MANPLMMRNNAKKRGTTILVVAIFIALGIATAILAIAAFPSQAFNSGVKIKYFATDIDAEVQAWYKEKTGTKTYLTTTEGGTDTVLKLEASEPDPSSGKELFIDKDIVLTKANNYVIFCYEFTNTGTKTIAADHLFTNAVSGVDPVNFDITYSLDGTNFDSINTGFSLTAESTKAYYFKIEVKDLAFNSSLEGAINWDLNSLKNATTNADGANDPVRIGSLSYTTFEEAYSAAQSGDIVTISEDVTLSDNFAVKDNVQIIAEPKTTVAASGTLTVKSTNEITITMEGSITLDKKNVVIGANNGSSINLTSNNSTIGDLFLISGKSLLELRGVKFTPATDATSQRAAYVKEATFAMIGGELSGFKHVDGAAIYFEKGTGEFTNTNILNNTSSSFGGALVNNASTITINGGLINGNSATQTGGFIYGNKDSELIANNCEISNNQAGTNGGAICVEGGDVKLNNVQLLNNSVTSLNDGASGGAIYLGYNYWYGGIGVVHHYTESSLVINGGIISGNSAYYGGAICDIGAARDVEGGHTYAYLIRDVLIKNCKIENNTANNYSVYYDAFGIDSLETCGTVTFETCEFKNNSATREGSVDINGYSKTFKNCVLDDVKIMNRGYVSIKLLNCTITGSSELDGGVIYQELSDSYALVQDCEVYNSSSAGNGGFALISYGELTISNSKFYNCSAEAGGGVLAQTGGTININDCEFYSNTANSTGGVVYKNGGTLNITNSKIYNNSAKGSGGAIQNDGGDTTLTGVEMYGNTSQEGNGSAILGNAGNITIENGTTIYNHTSTNAGGAIRVGLECVLTMNGGEIKNNTAGKNNATAAYGGGVYVSAGGKFVMNGGTIHNNKVLATYSFGGNVYVDKTYSDDNGAYECALFELKGGTISGDGSTKQAVIGGGVAVMGNFVMTGGTIFNCVAEIGGGLANLATSTLTGGSIVNCVANNSASNNSKAVANNGTLNLGNVTLGSGQDIAMGYQNVTLGASYFPEGYGSLNVIENLTNTYTITFVQVTGLVPQIKNGSDVITHFTGGTVFAIYINGATADVNDFITSGYTFYVNNGNVYMQ